MRNFVYPRTALLATFTIITFALYIAGEVIILAQEDLQEGEIHLGSYGYICTSECRKSGYSYNWCEARHPTSDLPGITYWDYCSKKQNHDYRGRRCWHEHACGNHGYKYKWCYIPARMAPHGAIVVSTSRNDRRHTE